MKLRPFWSREAIGATACEPEVRRCARAVVKRYQRPFRHGWAQRRTRPRWRPLPSWHPAECAGGEHRVCAVRHGVPRRPTFMRHRRKACQALGANRSSSRQLGYVPGTRSGLWDLLHTVGSTSSDSWRRSPTVDAALVRAAMARSSPTNGAPEVDTSLLDLRRRHGFQPTRRRRNRAATAGSAPDEVRSVTRLWSEDLEGGRGGGTAPPPRAGRTRTSARRVRQYVEAQAHFQHGTTGRVGRAIDALRGNGRRCGNGVVREAWPCSRGTSRAASDPKATSHPGYGDERIRGSGPAGVRRTIERSRAESRVTRPTGRGLRQLGEDDRGSRRTDRKARPRRTSYGAGRRVVGWNGDVGGETGQPDHVPREAVNQALGQLAGRASVTATTSGRTGRPSVRRSRRGAGCRETLCLVHIDAITTLFDLVIDCLMTRGVVRELRSNVVRHALP